jgi:hypothetical protein
VKPAMSDHTQTDSHDDSEFLDWLESVSASQEEIKTLLSHPYYSLYQAKEHARQRTMVSRPRNAVSKLFSQFQDRYEGGWKRLMKTIAEVGHHGHFRGHHDVPG